MTAELLSNRCQPVTRVILNLINTSSVCYIVGLYRVSSVHFCPLGNDIAELEIAIVSFFYISCS